MKVLVACEYSGIVRDAFLKKGHNAVSCDLLDTESPIIYEDGHYKGDVRDILYDDWDMLIAHPPCTYLAVTQSRWMYHPEDKNLPIQEKRPHPLHPNRKQYQNEALEFVKLLLEAPIEKIALENPISVISSKIRKPDQIINPYQFGHPEQKKTCLWLKNLPKLKETNNVYDHMMTLPNKERMRIWWLGSNKGKERSKFYTGIADAMADQWG